MTDRCYDTCTDPTCAGCDKLPSDKFEPEPLKQAVAHVLAEMKSMTPEELKRNLNRDDLGDFGHIMIESGALDCLCDNCGNLLPNGYCVQCQVCGFKPEC